MKRELSVVALLVLLLALPAAAQAARPRRAQGVSPLAVPKGPKYRPNTLLVRFHPGSTAKSIAAAHAAVGAAVVQTYRIVPGLQRVQLPQGMSLGQALSVYRRNKTVLYAEPDYVVHLVGGPVVPNDPQFPNQWDLNNTGQTGGTPGADIKAEAAWGITTGNSSVVIGVIDTGVDYNHPDLMPNMWVAPFSFTDGGITCPSGSRGLNPVYGTCDPNDDFGHGTHVAGTIGARTNNSTGVAGINWSVTIIPCKFLDSTGSGFTSDAVTCLEFFKDLKDNHGVNVVATNNSWGGPEFDQSLSDAIDAHRQSGILFFAAAGNNTSNNDTVPFFPADYYLPNLIAVAATDDRDALAFFSNSGINSVALGAPGQDILSTVPSDPNLQISDPTGYTLLSGTSMATPHVAGVAALLAAHDPSLDWRAIKNLILAGGDFDINLGGGTITSKRLSANGSLTCTNSPVLARLRPVGEFPYAAVGSPLLLAVLNINCGSPAGDVTVTINPGGNVVTLKDDGNAPDQAAGDGIYSGFFTPSAPGIYTVSISGGETFDLNVLAPYFFQPAAFNYRDITATGINLGFTDDEDVPIITNFTIPFGGGTFSPFGGGNFTRLYVSANGLISFDSQFSDFNNTPLPTAGTSTLVAPFWTDLIESSDLITPSSTQNVFYAVTGTAPNRELVIEWRNVSQFNGCNFSTETVTFQAVFFENKSDVLFNYLDPVFGGCASFADLGAASTIGVQVAPDGFNQFSFDTPSLENNTALLWTTTGPNVTNPVPVLTSLSPNAVVPGSASFTLTVNGSGFVNSSVVRWSGQERPTTFVNSNQLTAAISAADVQSVGTNAVNVFTFDGGTSQAFPFFVADFLLDSNASLVSRPAQPGVTGAASVTYASGFTNPVSLSCSVSPAGPTNCTVTPNSVNGSSPLSVSVDAGTGAAGNYQITLAGTDGVSATSFITIPYAIWDYSLVAPAAAQSITGITRNIPLTLHPLNGQQNVDITCSAVTNLPGATCAILQGGNPVSSPLSLASGDVGLVAALTIPAGPNPCGNGAGCSITLHTVDHDVPATPAHDAVVKIFPPVTALSDFNADGDADILWQNSASGDVAAWLMNGSSRTSSAVVVSGVDPNWKAVGVSDFDADGKADILWQNSSTGGVVVWLMNGTTRASSAFVAQGVDPNWKIVGVGDFDGDGKADILWQNSSTGDVVVWLMNGASRTTSAVVASGVDPSWKAVGVGDFDGDGKADILWQNSSSGDVVVWLMSGASRTASAVVVSGVDPSWKAVGVGDFDADGKADILWQNSSTGGVVVWLMNGASRSSSAFVATGVDPSWKIVGVADYNGDGKADILWQNSSSGDVVVWLMNGASRTAMGVVASGVNPNWRVVKP